MKTRFANEIDIVITHKNMKHPSYFENNVVKLCEEIGYTYHGFIGEWKGKATQIKLTCDKGHEHDTTYLAFVTQHKRCYTCGRINTTKKTRTNIDDAIAKIKAVLGDYIFVGFDGEYRGINHRTRIIVRCPKGHEFSINIRHFLNGTRCKVCRAGGANEDEPGYIYVQRVTGQGIDAIKYGRCNRTPEKRLYNQKQLSDLNHEIIWSCKFESGKQSEEAELIIKDKFRHLAGFVPRELMRKGFTETLPAEILPSFLKEVKSVCNLVRT
ncbi:hypothetical protein VQ237_000988 [Salmonella enterica]|nr:hypothetical protein [Salmonella enterica]